MTHTTTANDQAMTRTEQKKMTTAEICMGAMMGVGAIAGMWGAVSLVISLCIG